MRIFNKSKFLMICFAVVTFLFTIAASSAQEIFSNGRADGVSYTNQFIECLPITLTLSIFIILLLLNTVNAIKYWLESQKTAITVKRLSGATRLKILLELVVKYFLIISIGFLAGISFLILFQISNLSNILRFANSEIHFAATLVTYLFCLFAGIITILPILIKYTMTSISEMVKS